MVKQYLDKIKRDNKKINAILQVNPSPVSSGRGKLNAKVIAVKANINVKGLNASCGSKTLENYKAPYDATVVKKVKEAGGVIVGMANCDEFACGGSGETSAFGVTQNPVVPGLVPGGSSSGSAAAVAAGFCDMALGSDTGGSIRNPASHCGVVGLKPTYGSVSRYGLIDLSMSLDQIGPIARTVSDVELLFNVIKGKDENDSISFPPNSRPRSKIVSASPPSLPKDSLAKSLAPPKSKSLTIGVLDLQGLKYDERIQKLVDEKITQVAKKKGWKIKNVKLNYLDLGVETYYSLVYVEFFSATRKFDGRRYGKKIEDVAGPEVLRRILGGSEISKAEHSGRYYYQALKAKKLIAQEFGKAFNQVDVIVCPTVPRLPHKIGEKISIEEMYSYDALTAPANLAGICAMSVPAGKINNIPVGLQIMADKFQEDKLFNVGKEVEQ
jgi:aspartyl-tRNA(Asn)/glutamyl-tRNA(Gln) amidotransferase subunit A